ncbi:uncharacterized protein KY384_003692 [Bacidia gigantensis]|uniref:uncharacterized protein n=1 Tax=Bacidia gigantensis TaxID=2732470 RepID=UPI001D055F26|nr:uncharacterized protein KY384_003692 [Bacidia gigantensis]KAG8532055.1 hypothetical protein KY384_003692 [Bacidia gigantensis]
MGDTKGNGVLPPFLSDNGLINLFRNTYTAFSKRREALGLSNPGPFDKIKREVDTDVFLTKFMFTGLKGELNKPLSISPLFQFSHAFALGSQQNPPYGFSAIYGTPSMLMQGNLDNDGQLMAVLNKSWTKSFVTKSQASMTPGQASVVQLDGDYSGKDFTASIKSMNPSILDGGLSGAFVGGYLQSVTPGLALGAEAVWQRFGMNQGPETILTYCARYKGQDWIGTAQLTGQGMLSTSYWRRLSDKVEAGTELNLQFAPGLGGGGLMGAGASKVGTTTVGAKYDFRTSSFKAQLDSTGKLSCLLERRVLPPVQISFAGEIDHFKSTAKIGMAVSLEVASEAIQTQAGPSASEPSVLF